MVWKNGKFYEGGQAPQQQWVMSNVAKIKNIHETGHLENVDNGHIYEKWIETISAIENRIYYRDQTVSSLSFLEAIANKYNPTKIIELGTGCGLSLRCWIGAGKNSEIIAIDLSFAALYASQKVIPTELSRVKLMEQDIMETDFKALWKDNDSVLLFIDAHDLSNISIMSYVLENAVKRLPKNSIVVIDDLWYSSQEVSEENVSKLFSEITADKVDSMQCFEGYYAPYWKEGFFIGFKEVVPLMEYVNRNKIPLIFRSDCKSVMFEYNPVLTNDGDYNFDIEGFQILTGSIYNNPVSQIRVYETVNISVRKEAEILCQRGIEFFSKSSYQKAISCFEQAIKLTSKISGVFYAKAVCYANMGRLDLAIETLEMEINSEFRHPNSEKLGSDIKKYISKRPATISDRENAISKESLRVKDVNHKNMIEDKRMPLDEKKHSCFQPYPQQSKTPLVSIITICLNGMPYIRNCVESILSQDYPNIEYVVQDGGSTDGTLELLRSYGDRIKLVSMPDSGHGEAMNRALKRCTGEIIGTCNDDDELLPGAVSWAVYNFNKQPELDVIYGDYYEIDEQGKIINGEISKPKAYDYKRVLCVEDIIPMQSAFFKRNALKQAGLLDNPWLPKYCEDFAMWVRLIPFAQIKYIPGNVSNYRIHGGSGTCQGEMWHCYHDCKREVLERFFLEPQIDYNFKSLRNRALRGLALSTASAFFNFKNPVQAIKYIQIARDEQRSKEQLDGIKQIMEQKGLFSQVEEFRKQAAKLSTQGKYEEELSILDLLTAVDCWIEGIQHLRAVCLLNLNRIKEAIVTLRKELFLHPANKTALKLLTKMQLKSNQETASMSEKVQIDIGTKDNSCRCRSETPVVSIITICLNGMPYIINCVESVLSQDYPNMEYVVQDGGSTDGTLELLQSYGDRIKLVSMPDSGHGEAMNRALQRCTGDIIGICNDDDELMPHAASWAVENFAKYPDLGVIYGDYYEIDGQGNTIKGPVSGPISFDFQRVLCVEDIIPAQSTFYRRSALEKAGLLDNRWLSTCEDFTMWLYLGPLTKISHVPGVVSKYRLHTGSGTCQRDTWHIYYNAKKESLERFFMDTSIDCDLKSLRSRALRGLALSAANAFFDLKDPINALRYIKIAREEPHQKHHFDCIAKAVKKKEWLFWIQALYERSVELAAQKKYEEELSILDLLTAVDYWIEGIQHLRAVCLLNLNKIDEAMLAVQKELSLHPGNKTALKLLREIDDKSYRKHTEVAVM